MNKIQIIVIIVIALVGAMLVSTYTGSVDSSTFQEARETGKRVKIVGLFDKTHGIEYDAMKDVNLTVFNIVDSRGESLPVNLRHKDGKPMGLDQSENVTVHGTYNADGSFHADDIQMKCPSKYNDQKHELATQ